MGRIRFLYDNDLFDSCTLTASSENASFPASNLKDQKRKKVWRSTSLDSEYIRMDMGELKLSANALALVNHNLTANGQVRVTATDNADYTSDLILDTGYLTVWDEQDDTKKEIVHVNYFTATEARYWTVYFYDPDNPDGYFELGRLFVTYYWEPAVNFRYHWEFLPQDRSTVKYTRGGQPITYIQSRQYQVQLRIENLASVENWSFMVDILRRYGRRKDIVIQLFPDDSYNKKKLHTTLYGSIIRNSRVQEDYLDRSSLSFTFMESL